VNKLEEATNTVATTYKFTKPLKQAREQQWLSVIEQSMRQLRELEGEKIGMVFV
jgi:hypothetical protein